MKKMRDIGEIGLIRRLAKTFRVDSSVVKGIGDDAAVIKWTGGKYLLYTCDMLVEGVHFKIGRATPFEIGWKALGRNISDIAAMGGVPRYAVVSIGMRASAPARLADGIAKGLSAVARRFGVNIVGGDTTRSSRLIVDVSLLGYVEKKNLLLRSGARAGDVILVTGSLGGAIRGKHLRFIPKVDEARRLVKDYKVNAMIDISDGLALDLWRVLEASNVGARVYKNAVPLAGEASSFESAVSGGEDFELLFTMSVSEARRFFRTALARMKTPVTLIGEITGKKGGLVLVDEKGRESRLRPKGYLHF